MNPADLYLPSISLPADCRDAAALLNRGCVCTSVDHERLRLALPVEGAASVSLLDSHPNLFSDTLVFVAEAHLQSMAELIAAVERVVALPAWQESVLAEAPAIARHDPKAASVFLATTSISAITGRN